MPKIGLSHIRYYGGNIPASRLIIEIYLSR